MWYSFKSVTLAVNPVTSYLTVTSLKNRRYRFSGTFCIWNIFHLGPTAVSQHIRTLLALVPFFHCRNSLMKLPSLFIVDRPTNFSGKGVWESKKGIFKDILDSIASYEWRRSQHPNKYAGNSLIRLLVKKICRPG